MRIGEIRQKLAEWEAKWTADDEHYLGKFDDQEVYVPVFKWNDEAQAYDFQGYGRNVLLAWDVTGLGLIVDHEV